MLTQKVVDDSIESLTREARDRPAFHGANALLAAIQALASELTARGGEIEQARAMPRDIFEKIRDTGVFQAIRDPRYGGAGLRVPDMLPVLEALARGDASTAWSVMVGSESPIAWQWFLPELQEEIFGRSPDALTRTTVTPRPGIVRVEGGLRINGVWPLGSGSYPSDWMIVGGMVTQEDGTMAQRPDGGPEMVVAAIPFSEVRVLDTWHALGMRSTESHDMAVDDMFIPDRMVAPYHAAGVEGSTLSRLPWWLAVGPFHVGVVLGIAQGMIDEILPLAADKKPFLNPRVRLAADPVFQDRIGRLQIRLAAARALAVQEAEAVWKMAESADPIGPEVRARFRSAMSHVHFECLAVANDVFTLGGTTVLGDSASLQRRFRDIRTACQHVCGSADLYRPYGALLLGETPEMLALL